MIARKVVCRMTKREARAWAKARRAELDMAAVGRGMAQALFSLPQWQRAGAVLAFAAMPDEPDTAEILKRALADGKRLLLPRVRNKTEMDWVEIPALRLLRPGAFGIQEPPADLPAADPAAGIMTDFWHTIRERGCCSAPRPCCWTSCPATTGTHALRPRIF